MEKNSPGFLNRGPLDGEKEDFAELNDSLLAFK